MKNAIFQYEINTWLRSPLFYLLGVSFFLFALLSMLGTAGYFDGTSHVSQPAELVNSPFSLASISFLFAKFLLFVAAIFGGFSLYRDYRNNAHALLYSFPLTKSFYLHGKLGSAILVLLIISIVPFLGIWAGEIILGADNPKIGLHIPLGYIVAVGLYLIPTVVVVGVFVFVTVGISRNIFSGFIVIICFAIFQVIVENVFFDNKTLLALLDPFGQHAFMHATHDWDFEARNSGKLPISPLVIWNRCLWFFIAFILYSVFFRKFDFQYNAIWLWKGSPRKKRISNDPVKNQLEDVEIHYEFSKVARVKSLFQLMRYDFMSLVKNWMFLILCFFGILAVFFIQVRVSNTGEFTMLPYTRLFVGSPLSIFTLIVLFGTFLFSGFLINRARQYNMNLMLDATPVADWQLMLSKTGAISLMQMVQLLFFMVVSITIQIINGYYNFELGLYFFHIFLLVFPVLLMWNVTSHFVHSLFPNIFLSLFVLVCIWLGVQVLDQLGLDSHILKFNTLPALTYSDLSGYGHQLPGYFLLMAYWLALAFLLFLGSILVSNRGSMTSGKERWMLAKHRMNKPTALMAILFFIIFLALAYKIYKEETNTINTFTTGESWEDYKKEWEKFSTLPQPKITDIELHINLFPEKESFMATGFYKLKNQSDKIIDTIFIRTGFDEITVLNWREKAEMIKEDSLMKSYLYKLKYALLPGDSLELSFAVHSTPNNLFSRNSSVLKNGTYIQQDILPRLGYQFIEHELPLTDSLVNKYNYFHRDADYVNLRTIISTSKDQKAIAPGDLMAERDEGERKIFEYHAPKPIKFNFSFHSAKFELLEEKYKGVALQVYYIKGTDVNAKWMIEGMKASLDFNTKWFGPYPYQEARVIVFPHTEKGYSATLTCNNIPASENLFGMNPVTGENKVNLAFYVMAHELTHEWFGNQVMPADAEGAKMLTESITEYLTLSIYRAYFGEAMAANFLTAQYNRYNRGRKKEKGREQPLRKVLRHQEYIAYGKGTIAFHELAGIIGQDMFNSILMDYVQHYSSKINDYPTTDNFIELLTRKTSKDVHQHIDYWFHQTGLPKVAR